MYGVDTKLPRFETVFDSDPYVKLGSDENDKESIMAQGVPTLMYGRELTA